MRKFWAAVIAAIALMAGAVAWAAIPHSTTGVITGCYHNANGSLRVIDAQAGASCNSNETQLRWNDEHIHRPPRTFNQTIIDGSTLLPGSQTQADALCPAGSVAAGGGYINQDPANMTIIRAEDLIVANIATQLDGYRVTALVGPNGAQGDVLVRVACIFNPDL